ncbi:MAG: DUF1385 domain-containing protein [Anaerolineae bacterium]|jgi:uncharacterized protein YqhQ|nr:DUF1385 domain-containing protein [Anaerolineae bacterium]MBT3712735.1 DUF1385 domain-containing protein [Anaerolineae bacterium]MBT4309600.1 DUF1385 domain-containing protein [Anaerolineae bacterium]MBT4458330.1 DUF1385 domain-containing protein [Anaerolineae bacterium]MBT4840857.1 DUF1385 domain-containing protein [Anaerolineae bacterium]
MEDKLISYGGQAVIEGVMMRGKNAFAIAMRNPEGKVEIHVEKLAKIYKSRLAKTPFVRGLILLWDAMGLGMRALTISANLQSGEDEQLEGPALYLTLAFSLLLSIGLFFMLPATAGGLVERYLEWNAWWGNLLEGIVRILLLIGYVWAVGLMPEIQRVYSYHGAEHKTINAFEDGAELTPETVATYSREHARCGTAFLLTLVLMSIIVYSMLGPMSLGLRLLSRLVLIPVIAGMAYEYIKWTAAHLDSPIVQALVRPNMALQLLTTHEPDLEMLEVSIASFNAMREAEEEFSL